MSSSVLPYALISAFGVFISGISQVMLKKSAMREHDSALKEYLNPLVIVAYVIFVAATLLSVLAYRGMPLSMGSVIDATGYLWVTLFGVTVFHERFNAKKLAALALIIVGILVYSLG